MAGTLDLLRWLGVYLEFTLDSLQKLFLRPWYVQWLTKSQPWLEKRYPALWLKLLSLRYRLLNI